MIDISLRAAMKRIEQLNPRWEYMRKYGHGHLSFETTTPDGPASVLIEKGYSSIGTSSPITHNGFRVTITYNGRVIFLAHYNVEYKSGWFGGNPKPHYSKEYAYLEEYFEPYKTREQAKREEEAGKEAEKKRAEELKIHRERNRFFGR